MAVASGIVDITHLGAALRTRKEPSISDRSSRSILSVVGGPCISSAYADTLRGGLMPIKLRLHQPAACPSVKPPLAIPVGPPPLQRTVLSIIDSPFPTMDRAPSIQQGGDHEQLAVPAL